MQRWIWVGIAAVVVAVVAIGYQRSSSTTTQASRATVPPRLATLAPGLPLQPQPAITQDAGVAAVSDAITRAPEFVAEAVDAGVAVATAPTSPLPRNYPLVTIDGFSLVNLAGGQPTIRPTGGNPVLPTRPVSGRVVDRAGKPVAGAIVLVDDFIRIQRGNIMTAAGTRTDASGAFTIERAPSKPSVAIAIMLDNWSEVVAITGTPAVLHLAGHGKLTGKLTYDGHGEAFDVNLKMTKRPFAAKYTTKSDGELSIASLPAGTYTLTAGLAQSFGGGQSNSIDREITITDDQTTEVELALSAGATLAVTAQLPPDVVAKGLKYWLFAGAAPMTATEARTRKSVTSSTVGGGLMADPVQFHDVNAGTYAACAGIFDPRTMDAADTPFGCTPIVVAGDSVHELAIALKP